MIAQKHKVSRPGIREHVAVAALAPLASLPSMAVADKAEGPLATGADAVLVVPRGRTGPVALHGGTTLALETIVLALAASDQNRALERLDRLNILRARVLGQPRDV